MGEKCKHKVWTFEYIQSTCRNCERTSLELALQAENEWHRAYEVDLMRRHVALKEAAKALLDTYCDETYEGLKALVEDNDVGVEEQFQAGLRDVERNLREDK